MLAAEREELTFRERLGPHDSHVAVDPDHLDAARPLARSGHSVRLSVTAKSLAGAREHANP